MFHIFVESSDRSSYSDGVLLYIYDPQQLVEILPTDGNFLATDGNFWATDGNFLATDGNFWQIMATFGN